jgi:mannose-6-phosphate isomerase-like protein (cupin superfamily)
MKATHLHKDDLVHLGKTRKFEGYLYNDTSVSFFLVDVLPGKGALLHTHPYEEIHIAQEGTALYTVGDEQIEVTGGQIVIVPPNTPHGFVNIGENQFRAIGIHPVSKMIQTNLEPVAA